MYRIRIKKAPNKTGNRLDAGDQPWGGLLKGNPPSDLLPKAQDGKIIDYYKQQMLKKYGKYLITDKGTNRTYYGYPGSDGKMTEGDFEVLTGATGNNNYYVPYSLNEVESKSKDFQKKLKVTPVGTFPLHYNANIYGSPGLDIDNTGGLAMHTTYDPAVRNAFYNNDNPADNYASYGCVNCRKPDLDKVLKGFGDNDRINIIDSRKSTEDNLALARDNEYLYDHPEGARMLFESPAAHLVRRTWNAHKGVYEGEGSDYDPQAEMIVAKKDLAPVVVTAKPRSRQLARKTSGVSDNSPTPLQQNMAIGNYEPVSRQHVSLVDYLNNQGINSSKANRMEIAHQLGMNDYNYRAEDNIKLLHLLQERAALANKARGEENLPPVQNGQPIAATGMEVGDQANFSLRIPFTGSNDGRLQKQNDYGNRVRSFIPSTDRSEANIEAEKGETVWGDFDGDSIGEHYKIGGERHSQGGTPLKVPNGSFIFSDTRKMRIGGPILKEFGKNPNSKKKYTPAALAKQYNINKYKALLGGEQSDKLEQGTAQLMLANYQQKLGKLALIQEGMKGFPQGIPGIAMPLVQEMMNQPETTVGEGAPMEQQARFGGLVRAADGYYLPVDPYKGDRNDPRKDQQQQKLQRGFNKFYAPWLPDYGYDDSPEGLNAALKSAGYTDNLNDNKAIQRFLIQQNLDKGNYQLFRDLLTKYRMTNQGVGEGLTRGPEALPATFNKNDPKLRSILEKAFVDGSFGVRSGEMLRTLFPNPAPSTYRVPLVPIAGKPDVSKAIPDLSKVTRQNLSVNQRATTAPHVDQTPLQWKNYEQQDMPWWSQDMINMGAATANRYNIKKYMPTYVTPGVYLPNPTFFDPTRQLAANQEAAAQQGMLSAIYAGPQRLRSIGSQIQGQGAGNAANIVGQVQNQNVGVANQFELGHSELLNNKSLRDAIAKKTYLDELTTLNQQYDNAKRLGNENMRMNLLSGITNAQKTHWLNRMNSQFEIDPTSGRIYFKKGKSLSDDANTAMASNPLGVYNSYYEQFMNGPYGSNHPDWANDFAMKMAFGNKGAQAGSGTNNAEAMAMLQNYMMG